MLPPDYLEAMPEQVIALIWKLEDDILAKMATRIKKYGWTSQSQWEKDRLEAMGVIQSDIVRIVAQYANTTQEAIQTAMEGAGKETILQDRSCYEKAGVWSDSTVDRAAINKIINAGLQRTQQTFKNLTGTLANETAREFTAAMDSAWLAAATGTIDPQTAGRRAIKELCRKGITTVSYPSGHVDTIEVAVRRALVTGVNQSAIQIQIELAYEMGCDLVETTAHSGARPSHALWQGKVFSLRGKTPGYTTLASGTGYGTGAGLGGWNCRHSFYPFFEGSTPAYSEELLARYKKKTCTYDGQELTDYEASQVQRSIERNIRRWKREYTAMDAAGMDTTEAAVRLKAWRNKEADFLEQTGRRQDSSRSQVGTFGRSEAAKATWQNRAFTTFSNSIVNTTTSTGISISDVSVHVYTRCQERSVVQSDIVSALTSPLGTGTIRADKSQQFIGKRATVAINTETGKVITVWPTSTKKAEKLKKEGKL